MPLFGTHHIASNATYYPFSICDFCQAKLEPLTHQMRIMIEKNDKSLEIHSNSSVRLSTIACRQTSSRRALSLSLCLCEKRDGTPSALSHKIKAQFIQIARLQAQH